MRFQDILKPYLPLKEPLTKVAISMTLSTSISANQLRHFVETLERLEEDKSEIQNHIKDIFSEAKIEGFDTKIMKQVIRMRKMKKEQLIEQQELLDMYTHALGMQLQENSETTKAA